MPLTKLASFAKKVGDLADKPQMPAVELKEWFDAAPEELRKALNNVIDVLKSTTTDSGAKNIGASSISGLTGNDVQTLLSALKTLVDTKTTNTGDHKGTWKGFDTIDFDAGQVRTDLNDHTANKTNPHNVSSEQVSIIPPKLATDSGESYPIGVTTFSVGGTDTTWPDGTFGMVLNIKQSNTRFTQWFFKSTTRLAYASFRYWYSGSGWTPWFRVKASDLLVKAYIGNKTLSQNTYTTLTAAQEITDNYNTFNPTTGIFTVPEDGFYLIVLSGKFNITSSSIGEITATLNNTTQEDFIMNKNMISGSLLMDLKRNDQLKLTAFTDGTNGTFAGTHLRIISV